MENKFLLGIVLALNCLIQTQNFSIGFCFLACLKHVNLNLISNLLMYFFFFLQDMCYFYYYQCVCFFVFF